MPDLTTPRLRWSLKILAILFTLTGAVALVLEQAFEKMLSTLLGCSTPAAATVLGVYFAGLSLGGLAYGRWIRPHNPHPVRTYAFLEGGIAICALLMYLLFDHLISLFVPVLALGLERFWLL
jgi:spermidine synthase